MTSPVPQPFGGAPGTSDKVRGRGRQIVVIGFLAVLLAAALAVAWWRWARPGTTELSADWAASSLVLAGDGVSGWRDGDVSRARFSEPFDVAISTDGRVFVSDGGTSHRIRAIAPNGQVVTVAGGVAGFVDGFGPEARFNMPSGLAIDKSGTLYLADTGNNAIRRITPEGQVSTLAGDGIAGHRDGPGLQARFNGPVDVAVDSTGRVIVADTYNDRIRVIAPDGTVTSLAGATAPGFLDGPAASAQFDTPAGVAIDGAGNILVADSGNGCVRLINPSGEVSTPESLRDGSLVRVTGIAVGDRGDVYITDERGRVSAKTASGVLRTLAGSTPGFRDGPGAESQFRRPSGIAVASDGRLVVADAGNALVRLVVARDKLELRVPPSPFIAPRFDAEAFGLVPLLWPIVPMEGPHEIAGTLGEMRGSEGSERFHAGVDVRADDGTPVVAVRDGVVLNPISSGDFGSLNEWLRIGDLAYVHVRVGRSRNGEVLDESRFVATYDERGKVARVRVKRGARFSTGEVIASANRFNHVHLNVGWPGEERNALSFRLAQFEDHLAPTIARGGIKLFDENDQPLTQRVRGRVVVSGRVRIVVDAWDQADGNKPKRRLGLYAVGYGVFNQDGSSRRGFEGMMHNIRFDQMARSAEAPRLVYAPGSGIPFYGRRVTRFLYIATNVFRDGVAVADYWDTTLLPPGDYVLRVFATDIRGNSAVANRDLPVTIVPPEATANVGH